MHMNLQHWERNGIGDKTYYSKYRFVLNIAHQRN